MGPGGTHEVCAVVDSKLEKWFTSVGNPLSSVVADGGGWCLCKHWTRGALCCYPDTALLNESSFDWSASDSTTQRLCKSRTISSIRPTPTSATCAAAHILRAARVCCQAF